MYCNTKGGPSNEQAVNMDRKFGEAWSCYLLDQHVTDRETYRQACSSQHSAPYEGWVNNPD